MSDLDDLSDLEVWEKWIATPEGKAREKISSALTALWFDPDVKASPLCWDFVRLCQSISPDNLEAETIFDLTKSIKDYYAANQASKGAKSRHEKDPRQADKVLVQECWIDWQKQLDRYDGKASFARDMLDKFPRLRSQPVIEGWCRAWERKT